VAISLIAWQGVDAVLGSLAVGGWKLLGMIPLYGPPLLAGVFAWWVLFPPGSRPGFAAVLHAGRIAAAVNSLLPVAQVGGEVAKAHLIAGKGVPGPLTGAASVVDKTAQAVAQMLAALVGIVLLAGVAGTDDNVLPAMVAATAVVAVLVYAFYRAQTAGLFHLLARIARTLVGLYSRVQGDDREDVGPSGRQLAGLTDGAEAMEDAICTIYRRRRAVLAACGGRLANRLFLSAEVWLALTVMGYPVNLTEALLLETLNQMARSAAFFVPSAFGVQEGGYILVGLLIGVPPPAALALSLAKRTRELVIGVPALIAWHVAERHILLGRPGDG
jgi:putative membrane protein